MKARSFIFALAVTIIAGIAGFVLPEPGASNSGDTCCQTVCLTRGGRPVAGCEICVAQGSTTIQCLTTDANGRATFCNLTVGQVYTVGSKCCTVSSTIPSFTACSTQELCYNMVCEGQ